MVYDQTILSYNQARATGTIKNRLNQARLYIKFCLAYRINYLAPPVLAVAMYTRFLGNSFSAPATLKNYLSGAKLWVAHHLGDARAFGAPEPSDVFKHVSTSLNHVTKRAYPLTPADLMSICQFLESSPSVPPAVKPCILLAYASFLRASNITSPTTSTWTGPHTLKACDILEVPDGLCIVIRSTKTISGPEPTYLQIYPADSRLLCPVQAWKQYKARVKPWPFGPAFIYEDTLPLTLRPIVALMRLALRSVGHPLAHQVTMHSLRRGGVQCAANAGATHEQLMVHGTWKSKGGRKPYITEDQGMIPRCIAESLAD